VDVALTLTADAFPTFDATVPATLRPEGEVPGITWSLDASVDPRDDLDLALPEPTTFDAGTVDRLEAHLRVGGHEDHRGVELSWRGEVDDGGGEDGSASILHELLYMAQLERDAL
ncbi:MAG: hypothetical protein AAF602_24850, partial [Myxococcota bacterium]